MEPIVGIVAEYNPFHNGHLYQLREAKRRSGADCAVAAVMLQRMCLFLQIENEGQPISFSDEFQISPWAKEAVSYVSAVTVGNNGKLMQGVGNGRFDPQGHYTVEQSIATFVNLINH